MNTTLCQYQRSVLPVVISKEMNMVTSILIYLFSLFTLYQRNEYSVIVFSSVETSAHPPFYQHQTCCAIYRKHFSSLKYA